MRLYFDLFRSKARLFGDRMLCNLFITDLSRDLIEVKKLESSLLCSFDSIDSNVGLCSRVDTRGDSEI